MAEAQHAVGSPSDNPPSGAVAPASDAMVGCGLLLLVAATKIPVLATPYYWDESLWIGFAHSLAKLHLWQVLPGLHEPFLFGNRLPGLFLPMAAVFKLTGPSILASHVFVLCFAFLGVWFTYRLGCRWFGRAAGLAAALFLFSSPLYFAQSAMFLADLPAAATAVAAVYFGVERRFPLYWTFALYLLFLKEPAVSVICAIAAWAFLTSARASLRTALADAARYGAPVLAIALYYLWQWRATGHAFAHYSYEFSPFSPTLDAALAQVPRVHRWLFVEQGRWAFALVAVAGLVRRGFRERSQILLIALIVLGAGYCYALLYFLPRYLLPAAPFLYLASAGALAALVRSTSLVLAGGALLVGLQLAHMDERPGRGNREWDLGYLRAVAAHREAAAFVERELPTASIAAGFPMSAVLARPELGYVRHARKVIDLPRDAIVATDVIVSGVPGGTDPLEAVALEAGFLPMRRFGEGDLAVVIYARPELVNR